MNKNRNGFQVMLGLIGMIKPLLGVMCIAIIMGCIGNLMAIFITILGGAAIGNLLGEATGISMKMIFVLLVVFAVLRGVLRYAEQASNHYIAFKLLARIRHQIFASLRKLAPAKLDGKEKGNLISIITSDIELYSRSLFIHSSRTAPGYISVFHNVSIYTRMSTIPHPHFF